MPLHAIAKNRLETRANTGDRGEKRGFLEANCRTRVGETQWNDLRLIVAHNPDTAAAQTAARAETIATLEQQATQWVGKLDEQDSGKRYRGRKLSDGGVRAKFYRAVCEAHLTRII